MPGKKGQSWSTLHHYLTFTDAAQWREVEMMEALLGKRVKTYKDTDLVGKICTAKLRSEPYEGEQTAKIARLLQLDEEEDDDDDTEPDEDEDNEPDEDDDEGDEEETEDYNEWSLVQLRAEIEARELTKGTKKSMVKQLEDDDETADEDEDEDEDADAPDYESMSIRELRAAAKEAGIATRGLDKDAIIEALEEEPEADDDEEPEDYSEWSLADLRAEAKERGIKTGGLDKDALAEALEEDDGDPFDGDDE
jgi:hypothetical protein